MRTLFTLLSALLPLLSFAVDNTSTEAFSARHLYFMENKGQVTDQYYKARPDIDFKLSATSGLNVYVGSGAIHYQFYMPDTSIHRMPKQHDSVFAEQRPDMQDSIRYLMYRMDVELIGANKDAVLKKEGRQDYYENYYTPGVGKDGATVYAYEKIIYRNIYPNIDWVLYVNSKRNNTVKYDFIVHPGGDPSIIQLKYNGASEINLNQDGSLSAVTPQGIITENAPVSYSEDGTTVASKFVLSGNILRYNVAPYEGTLVIDPGLDWGTYYGDTAYNDEGYGVTTDLDNNVYLTGETSSIGNIVTSGAYQTVQGGWYDVFLVKFDSYGNRIWGTFYGDVGNDAGLSVAIGNSKALYVAGRSTSVIGISTSNSFQSVLDGSQDGFLIKFDTSGKRIWGTYYGGSAGDVVEGIGIDGLEFIYLVGSTQSTTGLATVNANQTSYRSVFVAKFDSTGQRIWGTYFGGSGSEGFNSIDVTDKGDLYIGGCSFGGYGLATIGAHQESFGGGSRDAYLASFDSSGNLKWATYYGGYREDGSYYNSVVSDRLGNVYLAGYAFSPNNIASPNGYHNSLIGGLYDAFLAKFDSSGNRIWATYLGGYDWDAAYALNIDNNSNLIIGGRTKSTNGIATSGTYQTYFAGGEFDAFLMKVDSAGIPLWGTYYGGAGIDEISCIACDMRGNIFATGRTTSVYGISKGNGFQLNGGKVIFTPPFPQYAIYDVFLSKFCDANPVSGTITGSGAICEGGSTTFQPGVPYGSWFSLTGNLDIDSLGNVTGETAGIDTVIYVVSNACGTDTARHLVTIMPTPVISIQPADVAVNASQSSLFTLYVTGAGLVHQWQEDAGSGFTNINNGGNYSGANTNTLIVSNATIAMNMNKYRCVVLSGPCSDTSDPATLYVWPLSIDDVDAANIHIAPNPTNGVVTITAPESIIKVEVFSLMGQKLLSHNATTRAVEIDLKGLAAGVYIVKVNDSYVSRVVKK
ncbi:MAG: SBBP repeat-containing protein [Chitinophagales bacterium]|nr:SBBP repeat-containing protein [Chitinophagales bacterium]